MKKQISTKNKLTGITIAILTCASICAAADNKLVIDGSTTVGPLAKAFAEYYMSENPDVNITISESGSGNGAKSLINGVCDISNMSRFMKQNEFQAAVEKGILPVAHVVALDGIAVVTHPANPVNNLTIEQIRDIYTGKTTNWKELGGPDKKIAAISRDTNSGTYETFENLVMNKEKIASNVEYVGSNGQAKARVQATEAAIAYVGIGFIDRTIKALEVNGIELSMPNIVSGRYPVARPLYMFTNKYPRPGTHLFRFITLHLTEKGHEIIEAVGFVPLTAY